MLTAEQQKLVEDNWKLAPFILHKAIDAAEIAIARKVGGYTESDLISEATIGLCKAAQRFDPTKGFTFSTFAAKVIKNHIWNMMKKIYNVQSGDDKVCSLDDKIVRSSREVGRVTSLYDIVEDKACNVEERAIRDDHVRKLNAILRKYAPYTLGYITAGTMQDYAAKIGVSRQYVGQMINKEKRILSGNFDMKDLLSY